MQLVPASCKGEFLLSIFLSSPKLPFPARRAGPLPMIGLGPHGLVLPEGIIIGRFFLGASSWSCFIPHEDNG